MDRILHCDMDGLGIFVRFRGQQGAALHACVSLACTIPYLGAAITQLKLDNGAGGVTWLYFGSFLRSLRP